MGFVNPYLLPMQPMQFGYQPTMMAMQMPQQNAVEATNSSFQDESGGLREEVVSDSKGDDTLPKDEDSQFDDLLRDTMFYMTKK